MPIAADPVIGPVDAALATRLQALVADGRAGGTAFYSEAARARSLAAVAGPAQTESWIVAQEALSALEAARSRLTKALSDIDELASARIQSGGLSAGDQAAIEAASGNLRAIGERQSEVLAEISGRLAR